MADYVKPAVQGFAVLGAAYISGYIWCFSQAAVLTLKAAPVEVGVHQFKVMYNKGKETSPKFVVVATLCNAFLAYQSKGEGTLIGGIASPFALYVAAAICLPSIIPYTLLVMEPGVNRELIRLGTLAENGLELDRIKLREHEVNTMLTKWKGMNYVRSTAVVVGALLSAMATWHLNEWSG